MVYRARFLFAALLAIACTSAAFASGDSSADVTAPPPSDSFFVIPLYVHIMQSTELEAADCALTDADVTRIVAKVNGIWHNAGIHWGLVTIQREKVDRVEEFNAAREKADPNDLRPFRLLLPRNRDRAAKGLHVYYIHAFPVNGVYMGRDFAIVQETARLRRVPGGIDEPIPRVTAHELGHALGLPHRQDRTNLLASGTTGTLLNGKEVETARSRAKAAPGSNSLPALRVEAAIEEEAGDVERGRLLRRWIAEIEREADRAN